VPIPADCVRVNIRWQTIPGEVAINTLHFKHEHQPANTLDWAGDMTQRYANLVRDGLESAWSSMAVNFWSGISVASFEAYHLDTEGKTLHKATATPTSGTSTKGTGTSALPIESAMALSLYAYDPALFDPLSRWKRGRIYLPGLSQTILGSTTGRIVGGQALQVLNGWTTFANYVHRRKMDALPALSERAHLVVLSRARSLASDVRTLRVDDLVDVQRRRQRQLVPAVQTAPVAQVDH
jgi:hypothetical protein